MKTSRIDFYPKKLCVYGYAVKGKIIYIGFGAAGRPFTMGGTRNRKWFRFAKKLRRVEIVILGWFSTREAAREGERKAIHQFKPRFNVIHNTWDCCKDYPKEKANA